MNLKEIQKPVKKLLEDTDTFLQEDVNSDIGLINKISNITPITKGKKIRSTLLFLLAGLQSGHSLTSSPALPRIAASIEMLHLSSLIHDDIIDNSELRRGQKTLNFNVGNFISVLWGDYLFISSINIFSKIESILTPILLESAKAMIEGQIMEAENTLNFDIDLDTYFEIIKRKTSSLFAGTAKIASSLNGALEQQAGHTPVRTVDEFYRFGMDFGTIFQVSDDVLDIFSGNSGKDRFRDLQEGKLTLPIILFLQESKMDLGNMLRTINSNKKLGENKKFLDGIRIPDSRAKDADLLFALAQEGLTESMSELLSSLFEKYKIKESALSKIKEYVDNCREFLAPFPASVYKESLIHLLDFVQYRDY